MLRTTIRGLLAHKRRVASTSLAVILGVAFLVATLTMGATMRSGFGSTYRALDEGTDVVVRNPNVIGVNGEEARGTLDASITAKIRALPGVSSAAGTITGTAQIVGADGSPIGGTGPPTDGAAWIDDPALNPRRLVAGRAPRREGEVVIDARSAKDGHLSLGSETTVRTPTSVPVTVVGIARLDLVDQTGVTFVGFHPPQATSLFARSGQVTAVIVHSDGSRTDAVLRNEITQALPGDVEALTGAQLLAEQRAAIEGSLVSLVSGLLGAFAVIALVVAAFSIQNTFNIVMAQRTGESALLRAIGATRRQVLLSVLGEAAITGALASVVGIGLGVGLGAGLRALIASQGIDPPGQLVVSASTLVVGIVVGVGLTVAASLWPAVRSSRVAPIAALRDLAVESAPPSRGRAGAGVALAAIGVALTIMGGSGEGSVLQTGLGALAVLVAAVFLGPVIARPAARAIGAPVARLRGQAGQLAARNAARNPRRTASSALALMIGTAVVALLATFGASLRTSIDDTVSQSFRGDLIVTQDTLGEVQMSDQVGPALDRLPEVKRAVPMGYAIASIRGESVSPTVTDLARMEGLMDVDVSQGQARRFGSGQIAISERYRASHRLQLGDTVALRFADGGHADLRVSAVYVDRDVVGDLVMAPADWTPHSPTAGTTVVIVELAPGVSLERGRTALERATTSLGAPSVQDREQFLQAKAGMVDQLLILAYGLLAVAVVIALLGIANTLSLSIHERTRELGVLRAVGLSRSGVRSTVRWESVITALIGTVTGLGVGTFLGWGAIRTFAATEGFVVFEAPTGTLALVSVAAVVAGVLASVRPGRRAARIDVLSAISAG